MIAMTTSSSMSVKAGLTPQTLDSAESEKQSELLS
jgi:hypothetical protein